VVIFTTVGFVSLMAILMTQQWLPLNPQGLPNLSWHLAFNTAWSFTCNADWQSYSGEAVMSNFSQTVGLSVHQFLSGAAGSRSWPRWARPEAGDGQVHRQLLGRPHPVHALHRDPALRPLGDSAHVAGRAADLEGLPDGRAWSSPTRPRSRRRTTRAILPWSTDKGPGQGRQARSWSTSQGGDPA
jgi:hypothetical protein